MVDYITLLDTQCYNPTSKAKFLSDMFADDLNKAKAYITTFKAFYKYEDIYENDLLNWTYSMLVSVFENMKLAPSSFDERLRQVKSYYLYYGKSAPRIKFKDLDSSWMTTQYFDSFENLDSTFSQLFDKSDKDTLNIMRKACVYLLFLGVDKDDIPRMLKSDISDTENRVNGVCEEIAIPDFVIETLRKCKHMKNYYLQNSQYRFNYSERDLVDSEYLIRGDATHSDNNSVTPVFIRRIFENEELKTINMTPTIVTVRESGLFCYVYEKEKHTENFSLNEFKELVQNFNPNMTDKKGYLHVKYNGWKKAFK